MQDSSPVEPPPSSPERASFLGDNGDFRRLVTKGVTPNLTILLDCEAATGLGRKLSDSGQQDRFEEEETAFHERIRKGYLKVARKEQKRFFVIDGQQSVEAIHEAIRERVENLLKSHGI